MHAHRSLCGDREDDPPAGGGSAVGCRGGEERDCARARRGPARKGRVPKHRRRRGALGRPVTGALDHGASYVPQHLRAGQGGSRGLPPRRACGLAAADHDPPPEHGRRRFASGPRAPLPDLLPSRRVPLGAAYGRHLPGARIECAGYRAGRLHRGSCRLVEPGRVNGGAHPASLLGSRTCRAACNAPVGGKEALFNGRLDHPGTVHDTVLAAARRAASGRVVRPEGRSARAGDPSSLPRLSRRAPGVRERRDAAPTRWRRAAAPAEQLSRAGPRLLPRQSEERSRLATAGAMIELTAVRSSSTGASTVLASMLRAWRCGGFVEALDISDGCRDAETVETLTVVWHL